MDQFIPILHLTTPAEIQQLRYMDVQINVSNEEAATLINAKFANLNLLEWVKKIKELLEPISMPPLAIEIDLKSAPVPAILLHCYDKNADHPDYGLSISRILSNTNGQITVKHDYFTLPEPFRAKGIARAVTIAGLQQYSHMGADKITIYAALANGGYTWARNGFVAVDKTEMQDILERACEMLDGTKFAAVKRIFDRYYDTNPAADSFPIIKWAELPFMKQVLCGTMWHGEIDLKKQNQLLNFIKYVHQ